MPFNNTYQNNLSKNPCRLYRYSFQGQERDDEIKGQGNSYNYKYRMHDPRLGRFFAVDPLAAKYPHYTPYSFSGNKVIAWREFEGKEESLATLMDDMDNRAYLKGEISKQEFLDNKFYRGVGALIGVGLLATGYVGLEYLSWYAALPTTSVSASAGTVTVSGAITLMASNTMIQYLINVTVKVANSENGTKDVDILIEAAEDIDVIDVVTSILPQKILGILIAAGVDITVNGEVVNDVISGSKPIEDAAADASLDLFFNKISNSGENTTVVTNSSSGSKFKDLVKKFWKNDVVQEEVKEQVKEGVDNSEDSNNESSRKDPPSF